MSKGNEFNIFLLGIILGIAFGGAFIGIMVFMPGGETRERYKWCDHLENRVEHQQCMDQGAEYKKKVQNEQGN